MSDDWTWCECNNFKKGITIQTETYSIDVENKSQDNNFEDIPTQKTEYH